MWSAALNHALATGVYVVTRYLSPAKISALALVPVVAGIYIYVFKDLTAVVGGDAPSYINLDPSRPVGYGAFLNAAFKLGFGLNAIPLIQATFLLGCLWVTACAWTAGTGRFALALVWQGLTMANVLLIQSSVYLIPDAISAALIMLALASWIGMATHYSRTRLCVLLLVCGVAGLFRPTNLLLLVVTGSMLTCLPGLPGRERLIALGAAAAVSVLTLAASPTFYFHRYGSVATSSPAARGLLQKTLFTGWAPDAAATRCGGEVIETATRDVVRYLETTPPLERSILEDKYSNYLRFSVIIPELQNKFHFSSEGEANNLLACYVSARIKQDPLHFAARFAGDYLRLGLYLVFVDAQQRAQYETFVAANPPRSLLHRSGSAISSPRAFLGPGWSGHPTFAPTMPPTCSIPPCASDPAAAPPASLSGARPSDQRSLFGPVPPRDRSAEADDQRRRHGVVGPCPSAEHHRHGRVRGSIAPLHDTALAAQRCRRSSRRLDGDTSCPRGTPPPRCLGCAIPPRPSTEIAAGSRIDGDHH